METTPKKQTLEVTAVLTQIRRGNYLQNHYATNGPDGTRFTNSSKAELIRVMARKYGVKVALTVVNG